MTRRAPNAIAFCSVMAAMSLAGCDRSPQSADGATQSNDLGVAATTAPTNNVVADTGRDTDASGADVGGAGEVIAAPAQDSGATGTTAGATGNASP
jgi:hypothetical protein